MIALTIFQILVLWSVLSTLIICAQFIALMSLMRRLPRRRRRIIAWKRWVTRISMPASHQSLRGWRRREKEIRAALAADITFLWMQNTQKAVAA